MIRIDGERCNGCGICGRVCPRMVPVLGPSSRAEVCREREHLCIDCGQCVAVCQYDAIAVDGLSPSQFPPTQPHDVGAESVLRLLAQRRSVRRYKPKQVPRELIEQVLEAAHRAPPAAGRACVSAIVIDSPSRLQELKKHVHGVYDRLSAALSGPIGRYFVGRRAGKQKRKALEGFVMPAMQWYSRWYREEDRDEITRDAPVVVLFHAPKEETCGDESCLIAAVQASLMAEVVGLGACINGLLPAACNNSDAVRSMVCLPADHAVFSSITLGYPKYEYRKAIVRRMVGVRYVE